jgi:signal transduction histidine kinase
LTGDQQFAHDMKNLIGIMLGYSNLLLDGMPADDPKRSDIDEIRKAGESAVVLLDDWEAVSRR